MADKPHGSSATEPVTETPRDNGAAGVYVVNVIWRSGPTDGSEASDPALEERTTSRTVSAITARAVLRMLDEDTGAEPVVR